MKGFVTVSTTRMFELLIEAQEVIETFDVDKDAEKEDYKEFSLLKMRCVDKQYIRTPRYYSYRKAVLEHIDELANVCISIDKDTDQQNKEITISLTSFNELVKIVNKDWSFNEVFFINY